MVVYLHHNHFHFSFTSLASSGRRRKEGKIWDFKGLPKSFWMQSICYATNLGAFSLKLHVADVASSSSTTCKVTKERLERHLGNMCYTYPSLLHLFFYMNGFLICSLCIFQFLKCVAESEKKRRINKSL